MLIKELLEELKTKHHPVAKALHKGEHFKVLVIAFTKGMILKEHKTSVYSKLTILKGSVHYHSTTNIVVLNEYDEMEIPLEEIHAIVALEDSLCLLTQG
jgi:quercetin dioxygenase-like cupin family protein